MWMIYDAYLEISDDEPNALLCALLKPLLYRSLIPMILEHVFSILVFCFCEDVVFLGFVVTRCT